MLPGRAGHRRQVAPDYNLSWLGFFRICGRQSRVFSDNRRSMWNNESWSNAFSEEDGDPDAPSLESKFANKKDAVVLLLDASTDMLQLSAEGDTYFAQSLKGCLSLIKAKIISSSSDVVAIALYNTKNSKNENDFEGVFVFQELEEPTATMVKKIEGLADQQHFQQEIGAGPANSADLYKALWTCGGIFSEKGSGGLKGSFKRIMLFTNNDYPFPDDDRRKLTISKLRDLSDLDVNVHLLPFHKKEKPFDVKRFYWDNIVIDEEDGEPGKPFACVQDMLEQVYKKIHKKRSLGSCNLELAPGLHISVQMYVLLNMAKVASAGWLDSKTNDPLTCHTAYVCTETGAQLEEFQMRKYYPYGGEKVFFEAEEIKTIKNFGEPGLVLMGFKDHSRVKLYHNIKQPYFIYPNDASIKGSVVAFNALMMEMQQMNKVAICRLIFRKGSVPRFVALLPQMEKLDPETDKQVEPPGFQMIFLPYADDIRKLDFERLPVASEEEVNAAKKMIEAVKVTGMDGKEATYEDVDYHNPALQRYYKMVQALALDEQHYPEVEDDLQPDVKGWEKYKGDIQEFARAIYDEEYAMDDETGEQKSALAGKKRKTTDGRSAGGAAAKKAKIDAADMGGMEENASTVRAAFSAGTSNKLKVAQLKDFCKFAGLPVSGTKGVLLDRIEEMLGSGTNFNSDSSISSQENFIFIVFQLPVPWMGNTGNTFKSSVEYCINNYNYHLSDH
eukprot:g28399.t1